VTEEPGESTTRISEAELSRETAKAKEILAAAHKKREVEAQELEALSKVVIKTIEETPELLEKVMDAMLRDSRSVEELRSRMANAGQFREVADRVTRQLGERDPSRRSIVFLLVLAGACLLGGGATIPLLLGAKAELIYTNAVAGASLECAGAALAKNKG
jgi:hypothetical protein